MEITTEDRASITDLVCLHGHLCDNGELDRLGEVFTPDVAYDLTDLGYEPLEGLEAVVAAAWALGEGNPVGHHVTNVVVTRAADAAVLVRSKGIGVGADGTCSSVTYEDTVVRAGPGWRISRRRVIPHRAPLGRRRAS